MCLCPRNPTGNKESHFKMFFSERLLLGTIPLHKTCASSPMVLDSRPSSPLVRHKCRNERALADWAAKFEAPAGRCRRHSGIVVTMQLRTLGSKATSDRPTALRVEGSFSTWAERRPV
eukprot:s961_g3.t1